MNRKEMKVFEHKKILQYDSDNNFIKEWKSVKEVTQYLNISHSSISACCYGKSKSAGKFKWKFN
jgi:hypothetical protein